MKKKEKDKTIKNSQPSEDNSASAEKTKTLSTVVKYSITEQSRDFGPRSVSAVSDDPIWFERFNLKFGNCNYKNCSLLLDRRSNKEIGIIPRIPVANVWEKAYSGCKGNVSGKIGITKEEWNEVKNIISKQVGVKNSLIQDFWNISEIEFEELFLNKASRAVKLIEAAVKFDIEETALLQTEWKKIKNYRYKVALEKKNGGVFSDKDAAILRQNGVNYLNDIRKQSIYDLKNMFLGQKLMEIPEAVNAAFKEDYERRKDARFKVIPFIFGLAALLATMIVEFKFEYTLIKNVPMTLLNVLLVLLWLGAIGSIIWGALRAVRRRRTKRPDYYYFTKRVSGALSLFVVLSLVSMPALIVYYARYDGYNDRYYYRKVSKNEITISGLFDNNQQSLIIPDTIDGKQVVKISPDAFKKSDIYSVEMPDTVKVIGDSAFYKCEALGSVKFSSELKTVSKNAFYGCSSLYKVALPNGLETVGGGAFEKCNSFTDVVIPATVTTIGKEAFRDCSQLVSVEIKGSVSELGSGAFRGCTVCKSINFANISLLTRIEAKTFENCKALERVDFLKKVQYIGDEAFKNCSNLTGLTVGNSLEKLGKKVLYGCNSLTDLSIPFIGKTNEKPEKFSYICKYTPIINLSLTKQIKIPEKAFAGVSSLKKIDLISGVTEIGQSAFKDCISLVNFDIPASVTKLEKSTFEGCTRLENVTATASLTSLGDSAFKDCVGLTSAGFASLESIGDNCYEGCLNITFVEEMSNLNRVGSYVFKDCRKINSFILPDGLENIADYAFASSSINTVTFDGNVKTFGKNAFKDCNVKAIVIGDKVEVINSYAFANSNIVNITLGKSVKTIENNAFYNCDLLVSVAFNSNLESIGDSAFKSCSVLNSVNLSGTKVKEMGKGIFSDCPTLADIRLPASVTVIPDEFVLNGAITDINLHNVEVIGKRAFKGCALKNDILPDTVKEIDESAFENCVNLPIVEIPVTVEKMGKNAFKGCTSLKTVVAPFLGKSRDDTKNGYSYLFGKKSAVIEIGISDLEKIGSSTFGGGQNKLEVVAFSDKVLEIGNNAFKNFKILGEVYLPETLTKIGNAAFKNCLTVEEIVMPDSVTSIGNDAFRNCAVLNYVKLSENLTEIKDGAFRNCVSLTSVKIPDKVEKIGAKAFSACASLQSVELGTGVKTLSKLCFYKCVSLKAVKFNSGLQKIKWGAFLLCASLEEADYPSSAKVGAFAFKGCDLLDK